MPSSTSDIHGFLNVLKPIGPTSHDVVARIRRIARIRRVGHAGTLDPAASGVLIVAIGQATRLIEFVQDETMKQYRAVIRLGRSTTTDDAEGEVIAEHPVPPLERAQLTSVLNQFHGEILQVPPIFSALHHAGRRMYDLARAGEAPTLAPRPIRIDDIELCEWDSPNITLVITCGKGTYIRAIARDIGTTLGCGAHLAALERTAVGPFKIADSIALDALESDPLSLHTRLLAPDGAVSDWPRCDLDSKSERLVRNGVPIACDVPAASRARAYGSDGKLAALLRSDGVHWIPSKVFNWSSS